jgi:hypothetical protein
MREALELELEHYYRKCGSAADSDSSETENELERDSEGCAEGCRHKWIATCTFQQVCFAVCRGTTASVRKLNFREGPCSNSVLWFCHACIRGPCMIHSLRHLLTNSGDEVVYAKRVGAAVCL